MDMVKAQVAQLEADARLFVVMKVCKEVAVPNCDKNASNR